MPMNRRDFLASLAALGAAIAVPVKATDAQVDKAWRDAQNDPWFFEVTDAGTIVEPDGQEPRINSDIYDVSLFFVNTPDGLIDEVDQYEELRSHFQQLAADELDEVDGQLDDEDVPERDRLLALQAVLQDEEDGWREWVRLEGVSGRPRFEREIQKWLAAPVEWSWSDFWPQGWSSQGKALVFFQDLDRDIVDDLGVVIIEGEHPGSTYYAAELRLPVGDANVAAQRLGLPFRFKEEAA